MALTRKEIRQRYYAKNPDAAKKQYQKRKEKYPEYNKEYYQKNKEKIQAKAKIYYKENKEKFDEYRKQYAKDNPGYQGRYISKRIQEDPLFRLRRIVGTSIYKGFKGEKNKNTEKILGCSFSALETFIGGYKEGYDLDHVIPVSWATNEEELYALNHYSNFQLLEHSENCSKGNKYVRKENLERVYKHHFNTELLDTIINRNKKKVK